MRTPTGRGSTGAPGHRRDAGATARPAGAPATRAGLAAVTGLAAAACLSTPDPAASDAPAPDARVDGLAPCVGGFAGGTHVGTELHGTGRVALSGGAAQGTFTSPVFAAAEPRAWRTLRWQPLRPSLKALPDAMASEAGYAAGNADLAGNRLLLHLDDTPAYDDASGAGHGATCDPGPPDRCPSPVPGLFRRALDLDVDAEAGTLDNDRLRIAATAALAPAQVTVEAWVRPSRLPDGGARMMILTKGWADPVAPPFASYSIEYNPNGTFRCYAAASAAGEELLDGTIPVAPGGWHHVACTYDGQALRLYVDGVADGDLPAAGTLQYGMTGSDDVLIGAWNDAQFFDGAIDEVAIHDRALPASELLERARRGLLRLTWQVRVCDDAACDGDDGAWRGPDGTAATFYSEACASGAGPPALAVNDLDCDGDGVADDGPGLAVPPARFVQLRAAFDSHRPGDSPELVSYELCDD